MIGRVYKICSKDLTYIGSTVETLEDRLRVHHNNYRKYLNGKYNYTTSYEVIKDEHEIQLIYESEFETEEDLRKMEGEYQRKIDCVNIRIEGRTHEEYMIQWRINHTDYLKAYDKQTYINNKEKIKKRKATPYTCICGSVCTISGKSLHERTKKHLKFLNFINICVVQGQTFLHPV
jgi:hypothetical protein